MLITKSQVEVASLECFLFWKMRLTLPGTGPQGRVATQPARRVMCDCNGKQGLPNGNLQFVITIGIADLSVSGSKESRARQ